MPYDLNHLLKALRGRKKTMGERYLTFYWQDGYGIFSVNPAEIDVVIRYIKNQEKHHKKKSFQEEFSTGPFEKIN